VIPAWLWFGSFVHLALVAAFICTAVKEDEEAHLPARGAGFLFMIGGGTALFCGIVWAVQRFL
jgi:hypothetical protein